MNSFNEVNNLFNNLNNLTTVILDNSGIDLQEIQNNCFTNTAIEELSLTKCNILILKTDCFKNCKRFNKRFLKETSKV